MNFKILLLAMVLVLSLGMVSAAYDLEVTSVATTNSNPVATVTENIDVVLTNNGPDAIVGENIQVLVDFGDSQSTTLTLTDLAVSASTTLSTTHTWTSANTYSLSATASAMVNCLPSWAPHGNNRHSNQQHNGKC